MSNLTEKDILILTLIIISNIILIIVAFVLLHSGKTTEKPAEKAKNIKRAPKEEPIITPTHEIIERKPAPEKIKPLPIEPIYEEPKPIEKPAYEPKRVYEPEKHYTQEEIDFENYSISEYSDEEYKYNTVEEFENAQEENAIISYKELMKLKNQNNLPSEPEEIKPEPKRYSNTNYGAGEFISPVFGRMPNNYEYTKKEPVRPKVERDEEMRYNTEPKRRASKSTENYTEFLNTLKEFRNNL